MLNNGTILSERYEIIEKIGVGGMAEVYRAKDYKLDRVVAIKVLKPEYSSDPVVVAKFRKEATAAAGLSHNNIVSVYDLGQQGDIDFIVMEYVNGITLREYIQRRGQLNSEEILKITAKIADALKVAHENNIIHRDIKPQNILVTPRGAVKVADFGIAKAVSSSTITTQKEAVGSVHYLAPEQAKGLHADVRSDLYSLGISMYEMATGHVPFDGETPVAVAMQHLHDPLPDPQEENPELWPGLADIIFKLTQKKPEDRYQTAAELIADLRKLSRDGEARFESGPTGTAAAPKAEPERSKMHPDEMNKKKKTIIITAGCSVAALVLLILLLFNGFLNKAQEGKIPTLQGMVLEEAIAQAKMKGYSIEELEPQYHDTVPAGSIISQTPGPNTEAEAGTVIQVVVSLGVRETSQTPAMTGKTFLQATQELNQLGIRYDVVVQAEPATTEKHSEIGTVYAQKPEAGEPMTDEATGETKTLTLYVNAGGDSVLTDVPSLLGKTEEEAKKLLEEAKLVLGEVTQEYHADVPKGQIIAQSFIAQSEDTTAKALEGTPVAITVSAGPPEADADVKQGGTLILANPLDATQSGHLNIVAYDEKGAQTTLFNAEVSYETFSEDNRVLMLNYPDGTWYIRVSLNNLELMYLNINH